MKKVGISCFCLSDKKEYKLHVPNLNESFDFSNLISKSLVKRLKIKEKQFIGSGNYEREPREYRLDEGQISTEEFGKMTELGTKQYISLLLIRGTTPISNYEKNSGGDGVHKPEGRRKKGLHFVKCLERSKINYDKVLNQYNTKVWVFKNINQEKIDTFKRLWVEK